MGRTCRTQKGNEKFICNFDRKASRRGQTVDGRVELVVEKDSERCGPNLIAPA
jgi:hypothetical protein